MAYTVVKDTLQYLFGGQLRGQGACVCQCPAAVSGECGALERLLAQQLAQRECSAPGSSWHLHLSLGAAFLVIGIVLGVVLGRLLGRRSRRAPAAIEAASEAAAAAVSKNDAATAADPAQRPLPPPLSRPPPTPQPRLIRRPPL